MAKLDHAVVAEAEARLTCPECGAAMKLKPSRYGPFYGCVRWRETQCSGSHGAHPNGAPLGSPANAETKRARGRAHAAFDRLWQEGYVSRGKAYRWLAKNFEVKAVHIGEADAGMCERIVVVVDAWFAAHGTEVTDAHA